MQKNTNTIDETILALEKIISQKSRCPYSSDDIKHLKAAKLQLEELKDSSDTKEIILLCVKEILFFLFRHPDTVNDFLN